MSPSIIERPDTTIAEFPEAFQFLFEPHRYKVAYSGRGAAKSWLFARALLIQGSERKLRIVCARETQKSIVDSVHTLLKDQIEFLGLNYFYTIKQHEIVGENGTTFIFKGLRQLTVADIKSLEGVDICWVEEAQVVSDRSWEILIPTIRKDGSEIWVSFNPELETDPTYVRMVLDPPPSAIVTKLSWRDNPWFPETLRIEKDDLERRDYQAYLHVYEGEPRGAVEGAVYAEEMKACDAEGRITSVPVDRLRPVDTFWDLGFGDETAVWFAQAVDGHYHIVDYEHGHGKTIQHYLIQLQNRGYVYGEDWLPHDSVDAMIHSRLAGDKSRSIEMLMREAGRRVRIVPKLAVTDGINAARTILPQCRFDRERCNEGLKGLRSYQWGPKTQLGVPRSEPLHDWASHPADGFRALALALKQYTAPPPAGPPPRKIQSVWS